MHGATIKIKIRMSRYDLQPAVRAHKYFIVTSVALGFTSTGFAKARHLAASFPKAFSATLLVGRMKVTVKRKMSRVHARKAFGGADPIVPKLGTKCAKSGQPHAPKQFCLRQTSPWYTLAGAYSRFGRFGEEIQLLHLPEFEHRIIQTLG